MGIGGLVRSRGSEHMRYTDYLAPTAPRTPQATVQEEAAARLRAFSAGWTEPERLDVEHLIADMQS